MKPTLRIIKFGGTSVGDASCIRRVLTIIRATAREHDVVVVVSAMSGVTNRLIEAATHARYGDRARVAATFHELRNRHRTTLHELIGSAAESDDLWRTMEEHFQQGELLCQDAMRLGDLTPQAYDVISSLGERLSAPLVAAAMVKEGLAGEAVDATEIVVTNANHGSADPQMDSTRERCEARLRPLLRRGIIPVVTGFLGATPEGALTTLGRGGSDYSATTIGAAMGADAVEIWTDVDGLHTADPRVVPGARTIPEISYREAAELAQFGAKVLHPKTLRPVKQSGIPLWIRNTFAPKHIRTKITPQGPENPEIATALSAVHEVSLITVGVPGDIGSLETLDRILDAMGSIRADVLHLGWSSPRGICLVVPSTLASQATDALSRQLGPLLGQRRGERITVDPKVALITIVGRNISRVPEVGVRMGAALALERVTVLASAQGCSECSISFVVPASEAKIALVAAHREFQPAERKPVASLGALPQVTENARRAADGV
jgi:aspartate kinase